MENYMEAAALSRRPLPPQGAVTVTRRALPGAEAASTSSLPRPREDQVEEEVAFANALTEFLHHKVSFSYDTRIDQIVVTVPHGEREEVIRQFPSEEMIQLMVKCRRDFRGLIFHRTV
jgi:flagellar protein FlaG